MLEMTMKNLKLFATFVLGSMLSIGCANPSFEAANNEFRPDHEIRPIHTVLYTQATNGARNDATLNDAHFDGNALNSLGEAKLRMMADSDNAAPLIVYMNVPSDHPDTASRNESVRRYLSASGVASNRFKLEAGPNPNSRSFAARHLADWKKLDDATTEGGSSSASAGAESTASAAANSGN
jgi:hypothetical protein